MVWELQEVLGSRGDDLIRLLSERSICDSLVDKKKGKKESEGVSYGMRNEEVMVKKGKMRKGGTLKLPDREGLNIQFRDYRGHGQ